MNSTNPNVFPYPLLEDPVALARHVLLTLTEMREAGPALAVALHDLGLRLVEVLVTLPEVTLVRMARAMEAPTAAVAPN